MASSLFKSAASFLQHKSTPAPRPAPVAEQPLFAELRGKCVKHLGAFIFKYGWKEDRWQFMELVKIEGGKDGKGTTGQTASTAMLSGADLEHTNNIACPYCFVKGFIYCGRCKRLVCNSSVSEMNWFTCGSDCLGIGFVGTLKFAEAKGTTANVAKSAGSGPMRAVANESSLALNSGRKRS